MIVLLFNDVYMYSDEDHRISHIERNAFYSVDTNTYNVLKAPYNLCK